MEHKPHSISVPNVFRQLSVKHGMKVVGCARRIERLKKMETDFAGLLLLLFVVINVAIFISVVINIVSVINAVVVVFVAVAVVVVSCCYCCCYCCC